MQKNKSVRNLMEQKISYGHTSKARLRWNEDWDVKWMGCKMDYCRLNSLKQELVEEYLTDWESAR